jgi:hypothetical protein
MVCGKKAKGPIIQGGGRAYHKSLLYLSHTYSDYVLRKIFVNARQFAQQEDIDGRCTPMCKGD